VLQPLVHLFGGVLLCGRTGTVLGPGLGTFGFFLGVGDCGDLLWGFTGTVRLSIRINPCDAYSDRVIQVAYLTEGWE